MRITVITSPFLELPPVAIGAVEKLFYLLAKEWVRLGHQVSFVCSGGGEDPNINFIRLKKYKRTGSTKKDIIWDFFYSLKALWCCPQTDALLCNTFWTPALAPLFRWKYKKLMFGVHRYPKGQYWLYPFVHKFICVSSIVRDALVRQLHGEDRRVQLIVNPIDTNVFYRRGGIARVKGRVLFSGRIHPQKGLSCLAGACSRASRQNLCSELVLLGTYDIERGGGGAEYLKRLQELASPCKLIAPGPIAEPELLAGAIASAAVYVYPSEDSKGEACPVGPMEAMACGVPTVVSSLACYDDYVVENINALKFETGNEVSLCEQLVVLLKDEVLAAQIGAAGAEEIEKYSAEVVARRYVDVFMDS